MGIRLKLNPVVSNNYSFFCPDAPLSLSISKPIGVSNRLTPSIIRGLRFKTLIDLDGRVDTKTWTIKGEPNSGVPGNGNLHLQRSVPPASSPDVKQAEEPKSIETQKELQAKIEALIETQIDVKDDVEEENEPETSTDEEETPDTVEEKTKEVKTKTARKNTKSK